MKSYKVFDEALEEFRNSGGAMNYDQFSQQWSVGEYGEMVDFAETTPREQTEYALLQGGFTGEQIAIELSDWEDEPSAIFPSIAKALKVPVLNDTAQEIYELWKRLGSPEPPDGQTMEARIPINVNQEIDELTDEQNEEYNDLMITLLEATGIRYIGSGIWYTDFSKGTEEWEVFKEAAYEIASKYIGNDLWDHYCERL